MLTSSSAGDWYAAEVASCGIDWVIAMWRKTVGANRSKRMGGGGGKWKKSSRGFFESCLVRRRLEFLPDLEKVGKR